MGVIAYEQIANWNAGTSTASASRSTSRAASSARTGWSRRASWRPAAPPNSRAGSTAARWTPASRRRGSTSCRLVQGRHAADDTKNILFIMCDQLRWDYLSCYGHPRLATPNIDGARRQGRSLHARLCAVAGVRRLAHELLYGALRAVARRHLERRAAQGRRDDARRLPAPARARHRARRQDAHARRPARAWSGSASIPVRSSACASPNAASIPTSATTACTASDRTGATTRTCRATTAISTTRATPATIPGTTGPMRRRARATGWPPAGRCGMRASPRASREEDFETPYMTGRAMEFMPEAGDAAVVPASLLHQAALALHRAGALQRDVRPPTTCCRPCAPRRSGAIRIPSTPSSWIMRVSQNFARERGARAR